MSAQDNLQSAIAAIMASQSTADEKARAIVALIQNPPSKNNVVDSVVVCGVAVRTDATTLSLLGRSIKKLTADDVAAIARLTKLERLDLQSNRLATLPDDLCKHNPALKSVLLNNNVLTTVPPELFAHNPALKAVLLHDNHLTSVPGELFAHNPALEVLTLAFNHFTTLPPELFVHNEKLREVDFQERGLERVPITFYRRWNVWTPSCQQKAGRDDVARFVSAHPEALDLPLEVPVPEPSA